MELLQSYLHRTAQTAPVAHRDKNESYQPSCGTILQTIYALVQFRLVTHISYGWWQLR